MHDPEMILEDDRKTKRDGPKKRCYVTPNLVEIGRVRDLTAGASGSGGDFTRKKK